MADIVILPPDADEENLGSALPQDVTGPFEIHSSTALRDVESTKPTDSEPTHKEQELSLGNEK